MRFGSSMEMNKANSNYERAIVKLGEGKPVIGVDTKEHEDGRFFLYGMEVTEDEYNKFLDQYNQILAREIDTHEEQGKMAA